MIYQLHSFKRLHQKASIDKPQIKSFGYLSSSLLSNFNSFEISKWTKYLAGSLQMDLSP